MALINTWFFTKTTIDWETIEKATHNQYRVVSTRPYTDKKGLLPDGVNLTLMVIKDDFDYGIDKKTGAQRETNLYQNFNVTVLNKNHNIIKKGDLISLIGFLPEHSFVIGFDMLLRFKDLKILKEA